MYAIHLLRPSYHCQRIRAMTYFFNQKLDSGVKGSVGLVLIVTFCRL